MALILAEGFRDYADRADLSAGWPLHAALATNTAFADVSGRRTLDLNGGRLVRQFEPRKRLGIHFVVDLTAGSLGSTTLFSVGLNPAGVAPGAYTGSAPERLQVEAYGTSLRVYRRPFNADGTLPPSGTQTVATATHPMVGGASYRVEVLIDVSGTTGLVEVLVNGAGLIYAEFPRAFSGYENDAGYGILSLYAAGSAGARGRFSNVVLYSDAGATRWPLGSVNVSYLPALPNAGETISFPPLATDPEIPVETPGGKTWQLADLTGTPAILGVLGSVRPGAPNAVAPARADFVWTTGGSAVRTDSVVIQPGVPAVTFQAPIPVSDPAALNTMTLTARPTPRP